MATLYDLVLVHIDRKPTFFARIEAISADVKPGWWQVKLLVLNLPLQIYTWLIDDSQLAGAPFTMGGTPVTIEKIVSPLAAEIAREESRHDVREKDGGKTTGSSNVVSLLDRKKKTTKDPRDS